MHRQGLASDDVFDASRAVYNAATARFSVAGHAAAVARANAAVAQQNQEDTVVRAPFSGVVTVKAAQPGDMVSPVSAGGGFTRTGICTIVDMQSLALDVDISEKFISRIRAGQPATVTLNAYPDWNIPAKVLAVIPTADRAKATVRVRIGLETNDPRILPEMGARVSVKE
jgi:multidrug resistance efflux pump